jgi:hypothetical protein
MITARPWGFAILQVAALVVRQLVEGLMLSEKFPAHRVKSTPWRDCGILNGPLL